MLFQTIWLQAMLFQGSYHGFFQPGIILLIPEFYYNAGEKKTTPNFSKSNFCLLGGYLPITSTRFSLFEAMHFSIPQILPNLANINSRAV